MASLKTSGRGKAAAAPLDEAETSAPANPSETPGSYILNEDGSFTAVNAQADAPMTDAPAPIEAAQDPSETPGSYLAEDDGSFTSDAVGTVVEDGPSPAAPSPVLPAESAAAISEALGRHGQDIPDVVTAALADPAPAIDAEPMPAAAEDPALTPEAQTETQIDQPPAQPEGETA